MAKKSGPTSLTSEELDEIDRESRSDPDGRIARLVATIRELQREREKWKSFQRDRAGYHADGSPFPGASRRKKP